MFKFSSKKKKWLKFKVITFSHLNDVVKLKTNTVTRHHFIKTKSDYFKFVKDKNEELSSVGSDGFGNSFN